MPNFLNKTLDLNPSLKDWDSFRQSLYQNANFLSLLESSAVASELSTTLWNQDLYSARLLWNWLDNQGKLSATLKSQIEQAAIAANLTQEWEAVTYPLEEP